ELTGRRPVPGPLPDRGQANIYAEAVAEIADGTVIADFFLPYICCSNCSPIHFELPPARLGLEIDIDCTNEAGVAEATLKPSGASGAVSYQVDGGAFQALAGKVALAAGRHTLRIRDEAGTESPPA